MKILKKTMLFAAVFLPLAVCAGDPVVVVCPRALDGAMGNARPVRDDYQSVFADPSQWPGVFKRTGVVKFYLTPLHDSFGLDWKAFAAMIRQGGFRTEFETGGLRPANAADFDDQSGEKQARKELVNLRRWVAAGGTVDGITTDHAIMHQLAMNYRDKNYFNQTAVKLPPGKEHLRFDRAALLSELMDYFVAMRTEFPGVRFGVIESLGYFKFTGSDGKVFPPTDRKLPDWDFGEFLDALLAAAKDRGVEIAWFDIDFAYNGSCVDTRRFQSSGLHVGRTVAAVEACRARNLPVGIIFNDDGRSRANFESGDAAAIDPARNRYAHENTLAFARACRAAGLRPDRIIFQSWSAYPEKTGPEGDAYSFFNSAAAGLDLLTDYRGLESPRSNERTKNEEVEK